MSYKHLEDRQKYEDRYDRLTVDFARTDLKYFMQFRKKWFEIMPDEKEDSFRSVFHLNGLYMQMVGNHLLERYDNRDTRIQEWMAEDEAKDEQVANARLTSEPKCQHCGKTGLRILDKSLMNRGESTDSPEEVLFMLKCTHCDKNSACWEDGTAWEHRKTHCPKCKAVMDEKDSSRGKVISTTYTCPSCSHTYRTKIDLKAKKDKPDPDFESDKAVFCFHDKKSLEEHRDAKRRYDGLIQMGKEFKEKEDNKHIYDAVAAMKQLKIAELSDLLAPALEKAGYTEFSLDKPEMGKDVFIGFNCLDSKSDREDYDSRKILQKLVKKVLEDTNWRLMSDGISYRLGYLNGRLRAYEREEDLKELVIKTKKLKPKQTPSKAAIKKNTYVIKDKNGNDIHL